MAYSLYNWFRSMTQKKKQINSSNEQAVNTETHQHSVETEEAPGSTPEIGGPKGPEPTRYGDWERKGRCIDF